MHLQFTCVVCVSVEVKGEHHADGASSHPSHYYLMWAAEEEEDISSSFGLGFPTKEVGHYL